jgi:hypothetical protein
MSGHRRRPEFGDGVKSQDRGWARQSLALEAIRGLVEMGFAANGTRGGVNWPQGEWIYGRSTFKCSNREIRRENLEEQKLPQCNHGRCLRPGLPAHFWTRRARRPARGLSDLDPLA